MSEAHGRLPLHFEANRGQAHADVRFLARGPGYSLYLTAGEAVLALARPNSDAKRDAHSTPEQLGTQARATPVVVRMSLVGAAPNPRVRGLEELPGKANYFIGNDPAKWRTNVPTYAKVRYAEVYPGIDLLYYGNDRQLEYDFIVAPGAEPQKIVLDFQGAERLEIDAHGDLVLRAAGGAIRQRRPIIYQEIGGVRTKIEGRYVLKGAHRVGFQVAAHDRSTPLVIDPVLAYATYLGGSAQDGGNAIAVDAAGKVYVTGITDSSDFPISSGAYQSTFTGSVAFVTKLDPTKSGNASRIYSTYLGGSGGDAGNAIAVDGAGNAYVTGLTNSPDFPLSASPAPLPFQSTNMGGTDGFLTKLSATGSDLLYSTYFGGGTTDYPLAIAVDGAGAAYLTGYTDSADFPVSPLAYQSTSATIFNTGFVAKFDPAQSGTASRVYATYLGGSEPSVGWGVAVDGGGHAYVTGHTSASDFPVKPNPGANPSAFQATAPSAGYYPDAFVTKLNPAGTDVVYSTYLGGSYDDIGRGIAVDGAGNAYVIGDTSSIAFGSTPFPPNSAAFQPFPVTASAFQSPASVPAGPIYTFVTKLNAGGTAQLYSTLLGGGNGTSYAAGIAVDAAGHAYVTGFTYATNFPISLDAFQSKLNGNGAVTTISDAYVAKLDPTRSGAASLVYSSYLGGSSEESPHFSKRGGIAVDADGSTYVTGSTFSTDFPVTAATAQTTAAFQSTNHGANDGYVAKILPCATVPGTWAATGSMSGARTQHTATRLATGQVLIAGGLDTGTSLDNPLASALLYDPATGVFTPTGSMATPRFRHSATLLPSGKVLVAGGVTTGSGGICINSAELFDPAANNGAGAFTSAGSMVQFRADFTATLLPSGKVLFTGGSCTGGASAELYDPAANSGAGGFVATGAMAAIRVGHAATLLADGKVLVSGGTDTIAGSRLASAEIFDPAGNGGAGAFSATGSMSTPRGAHQATALAGGEVLVTGGLDASTHALASAEVFDPPTGSFAATAAMTTTRSAHTATRLASGQVLIAGGLSASVAFLDSAELFDQTAGGGGTGAFTPTLPMGTMRQNHSATLLSNGKVLVVGGQDSGPTVLASAELYSPVVCAPFNTPVGSPVSVRPVDSTSGQTPVSVTFSNVTGAGQTLLTTSPTGPTPPPNFSVGTGLYYHVETTATYSGTVTVCIDYGGTPLAGTTTQPVLGHFNSATSLWEKVTVTSWDPATNTICGVVTSLSPFALLVRNGPVVVPFATFRARLEIEKREFELKAAFTLGAASDGIAPLTEDVSLQVGSFSTTVPAGSFKQHGKGRFKFEGVIDGTKLEVSISLLDGRRFVVEAEAKRAHLTGTVNPVAVNLTIGNDRGRTAVRADEQRDDDKRRR